MKFLVDECLALPLVDLAHGRTFEAYHVASEGKKSRILLALSAFVKKTRRTPPAEIDLAASRLTDWRARAKTDERQRKP